MNITRGKIAGARKIVVYGPEGIGKSTFAAQFPDPVFIDTEGSTKEMDVARFDKASSWEMIQQQVKYIIGNPGCCRTLVIDTADWAEQIEITSLCEEKGWKGIEDLGYGKGYTYCAEEFGKFLNLLEDVVDKGVHVVITAHAQLRKVELPEEMGSYDHWEMKTSKKVAPMIREWADAVFFANYKTRIVEVDKKKKAQGGKRVMYTSHTPFWDAKNRYGLADELPFEYNSIRHVIEPPASAVPETRESRGQTMATDAGHNSNKEGMETKSSQKPEKEKTQETVPVHDTECQEVTTPGSGENTGGGLEPDKRIPKTLRDLMVSADICEWDVQNVVNERLPGAFPFDMPVKDYPMDFVNEWILPNWGKIVEFVKDYKENMEIPFN